MTGKKGGIKNRGVINTDGGHVVGGDFTINGASAEDLVDALGKLGLLRQAEIVNMQRRQIIMLAQRLEPGEQPDFDEAITKLARLVDIAVDAIQHGVLRGRGDNDLVSTVVAEAEEDARFAKIDPVGRITMTSFGMVLRLDHSATTLICDMMGSRSSASALAEVIATMGRDTMGREPVPEVTAHLVSALLTLGPTVLKMSDSASKGIAITSPWVGPSWCRSL